ncbi:M60 family metallopeptidase [Curtobacterium aurantiacum]|uniref:M60 family metallopeptidase n=1 Tax=Curtobacterium aurantiacum TaxID=3236919 RepID=A0ABS5VCN3_9MICO|nr:M60 family metallopeptidase [Curtobacterium flaccumfaciens]MBT1544224.1 M60 family metallopeptidase [Curtobacterium flaccumfaciens pv. flaccumfaciens]MBT1587197.1 M60 family metallopeptidase [Curtobacterium flaccumfaciens pv. flaccumfaciens]
MRYSILSSRVLTTVLVVAGTIVGGGITAVGAASAPTPSSSSTAPAGRASIVHTDDDLATTVLVRGQGDAETERRREGRSYRHSDLQPASRFAPKGTEVEVTLPAGAPAMHVGIGLYGNYAAHNGGSAVGIKTFPVTAGTTTVTAPVDGLVYLIDRSPSGSHEVTVRGGAALPTFILGTTSDDEFASDMGENDDAAFVTIIGARTFSEPPNGAFSRIPRDLSGRVELWDRVVGLTNAHFGLLDDAVGLARKSPQRLHITMPDTGGAYASAGHDRITMPRSSGAASELLAAAPGDMWGFWHEVGHTYQTPAYNWAGMGEVVVNTSVLDVQHAISGENRLDRQSASAVAAYFAKPLDERAYHSQDGWVKILTFDQLRRSFGEHFYPRLNQALRTGLALGEVSTPDNGDSKHQLFARTAATIADRDLRPFFAEWGFPLSAETSAALAELPPLTTHIWENRTSATDRLDHDLAPYAVPVGRITGDQPSVVVGQQRLDQTPEVTDLQNTDGHGVPEYAGQLVSATATGTGTLLVALRNSLGIREVLTRPVTVTPGNMFSFDGLAERNVMRLVTDPRERVLRLFAGTTYNAHASWGGNEYVGFTLRSADRREQIGTWSVRGNETAHALASGFAQAYEDGQVLEVRHAEARSRLDRWADSALQPADAATVQRYRITDGRFEPMAADPIVPSAAASVALSRRVDTRVEARLATTRSIEQLSASVTLNAPSATTFAPGQTTLIAEIRRPNGSWTPETRLDLGGLSTNDSGTVLTATLDPVAIDLPSGTLIRWSPLVRVGPGAPAGSSGLGYVVAGTVDGVATRIVG